MRLIKGIILVPVMLFTTVWSSSFCLCYTGYGNPEQLAPTGCCGAEAAQVCCTTGEQLSGQDCFRSGNTAVAVQIPVAYRAALIPLKTLLVPQTFKVKMTADLPDTDHRARDCLRTSRLVALLI